MDFNSALKHLFGSSKENKYAYTEPEIQAQRDAVANLKMSGVSQMVVDAQENRLRDMEAKKQQPVDKALVNESTAFLKQPNLQPQFSDPNNTPSSFDVSVSDNTVPMNGRFDSVANQSAGTPSPELPPLQPDIPPMMPPAPASMGGSAASKPSSSSMSQRSVEDLSSMGGVSNEDQDKRDALAQQEKKNKLMQLFPQLMAGAGDVITAGGAPYGTKPTESLDKVVKIGKDAEKGRKDDLEKNFLTDPKSGMSKVAQSAAARLLGKKPEEMASLSLAQIDKAFPIWKEALNNEQAMELKKLQIEAIKATKEAAASTKEENFREKQIQQIRQNLTSHKSFGNLQEMNSKFAQMSNAAKNPTAYGDLTVMFSFMKALDPTSVVREGEQDRFVATASLPQAFANKLNKLASGKTLSPDQRSEVVNIAKEIRGQALEGYKTAAKPSLEQAKRLNYSLSEIDPMFEEQAVEGKKVVKKQYSKSANKTKLIYSDGSEEIVDGQK